MCIHPGRDSFLEEWPRSRSVGYEPAPVAPPPLITIHCFFFCCFSFFSFFFQHEASECLIIPDNHLCFLASQIYVGARCMYFQSSVRLGPVAAPPATPFVPGSPAVRASGSERGIITPLSKCWLFSRPGWNHLEPTERSLGSGSRYPPTQGCRGVARVGANENSHKKKKEKSKAGRWSSSSLFPRPPRPVSGAGSMLCSQQLDECTT